MQAMICVPCAPYTFLKCKTVGYTCGFGGNKNVFVEKSIMYSCWSTDAFTWCKKNNPTFTHKAIQGFDLISFPTSKVAGFQLQHSLYHILYYAFDSKGEAKSCWLFLWVLAWFSVLDSSSWFLYGKQMWLDHGAMLLNLEWVSVSEEQYLPLINPF